MSHEIGLLNEKPLHAALKAWYAKSGDRIEVQVAGFVIDIVRGDLLVEIQTGSFSKIKKKLENLIKTHPVRLIYPIAQEKWIIKRNPDQEGSSMRRKSPKHGDYIDIFNEMVYISDLFKNPNLTIESILIQEEEVRRYDVKRAWRRRGWVIEERRLLSIKNSREYKEPANFLEFLPPDLPQEFTTKEISQSPVISKRLAGKMAYCLRKMDAIKIIGKRSRAFLYSLQ